MFLMAMLPYPLLTFREHHRDPPFVIADVTAIALMNR